MVGVAGLKPATAGVEAATYHAPVPISGAETGRPRCGLGIHPALFRSFGLTSQAVILLEAALPPHTFR